MQLAFSASEVEAIVGSAKRRGATTDVVRGISALTTAGPGDLTFLGNQKYKAEVARSKASVVLVPMDFGDEPGPNQLFIQVDNPSLALARFCSRIEQALWPKPAPGIHPSAVISPEAKVAPSATIGPLCVIEAGVEIGEGSHLQAQIFVGRGAKIGAKCWFMPGCTITTECRIGNRVLLQPGVIIGGDGFGYEFVKGRHEKVPQVGIVEIHDDVEVGANTTIDRARFSSTVIGEGTKIDNLVQIGHNTIIGKHCMICGQVGFAGSCTLGDYVVIGGQTGLAGHLTIANGVKVGAQSGIMDDLPANTNHWGSPSLPALLERKLVVLKRRLPELFKRVDALEEQIRKG